MVKAILSKSVDEAAIEKASEALEIPELDLNKTFFIKEQTGKDTFLTLAARTGNAQMVELLLETGKGRLDINATLGHNDGLTALSAAALFGYTDCVKLLIKYGADVSVHSAKTGDTALHYAVERSNEAIAELLIQNGAEVNARENSGLTCLHFAAQYDSKCMGLLIEQGNGHFDYYRRQRHQTKSELLFFFSFRRH